MIRGDLREAGGLLRPSNDCNLRHPHPHPLSQDFIRRLLVYNPAKRMTAEQALKHPWLQRAKHAEAAATPLDPEVRGAFG